MRKNTGAAPPKPDACGSMTSMIRGAPICTGGASPLRVATGGDANWRFGVRLRRSPARANARRDDVSGSREDASPLRGAEKRSANLTHIGHLFTVDPRASLRSDNCPISIGMGVRFGLEQMSAFVGIRNQLETFSNSGKYAQPGTQGGRFAMSCRSKTVFCTPHPLWECQSIPLFPFQGGSAACFVYP